MSVTLLDWRRRVAQSYADARATARTEPEPAWQAWRAARDELFAAHPDSPDRDASPLPFAPYDPALRFDAELDVDVAPERLHVTTSDAQPVVLDRIGRVHLPVGDLDVWWLAAYAGGLFLPFADATNGTTTYGGGRYLLDTAKGADLGGDGGMLVVDFNFAYNPSCAYSPRWVCPLPPPGNRLSVAIDAGELAPR
ncbi:MAG: DUF1684 domain-containing protein [Mycobacteriales bacterium]